MEFWKLIDGFNYEVSDRGRVRSMRTSRLRALAVIAGKYYAVHLWRNNKAYPRHVHRLVAEAFLPGPRGQCVRHLNGDGFDNRLENLAWGSYKQNEWDKCFHGRLPHGEKNGHAVLTDAIVRRIRSLRLNGLLYKEISHVTGIKEGTIGYVLRGETWRHVD